MLPVPVTMASPGIAPGIHVFLPWGCKDVGWVGAQTVYVVCAGQATMPGHDEWMGRILLRGETPNEHPGQQPLSSGPRPLARRPRRVLERGGARDRLDRAREEDIRSRAGALRPLVCRWCGQHLLQRARPPRRGRTRRPGGTDPRFAAR